jgi:hypothetical protein
MFSGGNRASRAHAKHDMVDEHMLRDSYSVAILFRTSDSFALGLSLLDIWPLFLHVAKDQSTQFHIWNRGRCRAQCNIHLYFLLSTVATTVAAVDLYLVDDDHIVWVHVLLLGEVESREMVAPCTLETRKNQFPYRFLVEYSR